MMTQASTVLNYKEMLFNAKENQSTARKITTK